jgi:hypothetical protein
VFINGCSSKHQAQELIKAGVPAVIGTAQPINDAIATDLAERFYKGIAQGVAIHEAWAAAVSQVKTQIQEFNNFFPWEIYYCKGKEDVKEWNLPAAANDPLFGLPEISLGDLPHKPYRHLHWFTRKHAEVFFGRSKQIRSVYNLVMAQHSAPIILLYGQSGVGKSSFLEAGLLPRLETSHEIRYCRRQQELGLLGSMTEKMAPMDEHLPLLQAWHTLENEHQKPLLMILDQVEEVFTRSNEKLPNELHDFFEALKATFTDTAQRPKGKLILGFRKEWLAEIEKRLRDHKLFCLPHFLEPLDRDSLIKAITGPARVKRLQQHYGLSIDDYLAEIIADDLWQDRDSPIAPTLQILLTKMWDEAKQQNHSHPRFEYVLYSKLKKQGILLQDFLLQQLKTLHDWNSEVVDSGLALDVLAFHTTPLGSAEQRTVEQLAQRYSHRQDVLPALIQQFKDLYLLVDSAADQPGIALAQTTRLAHDTLAPLVRELFDKSDRPGQRAGRILGTKLPEFKLDENNVRLDEAELIVIQNGKNGMRQLAASDERLVTLSMEQQRLNRIRNQAFIEIMKKHEHQDDGVKLWLQEVNYYDSEKNPTGKGIVHQYELQMDGLVVYDGSTKLYWEQSGSSRELSYESGRNYIEEMNTQKFAGHDTWRLPTLEETMSLMESEKKEHGLHINLLFDPKKKYILTKTAFETQPQCWGYWAVDFKNGNCYLAGEGYVRAVRSE